MHRRLTGSGIVLAFLIALPPSAPSAPAAPLTPPLDLNGSIMSVYPLPSSGEITAVVSLGFGQEVALRLFDRRGTRVRESRYTLAATASHALRMHLQGLPSGVYFLRYESVLGGEQLGFPRKVIVLR